MREPAALRWRILTPEGVTLNFSKYLFTSTHLLKWQSIYYYFAKWKKDGTWYRIHETLRAEERIRQGKNKHPTAAAADWQSVKTTALPSSRGFDGGKKINGRKRYILVDTLGLMMAVVVTTACIQDRDGLKKLLRSFWNSPQEVKKGVGQWRLSGSSNRVGESQIPLLFRSGFAVR